MSHDQHQFYPPTDTGEFLAQISELPRMLPDNWWLSDTWPDTLCTHASLSNNEFVWDSVFKAIRKATLKPGYWKVLYPSLNEIQRPVDQRIVHKLLLSLNKTRAAGTSPHFGLLLRRFFVLLGNDEKIFWPHLLLLLKGLTENKRFRGKSGTRRLFIKYAKSLSWNACKRCFEPKPSRNYPESLPLNESFSWNGKEKSTVVFIKALIKYQANELLRVREISRSLSTRFNRPFLTMHNATLGASSGWGIQSFRDQIKDPEIYKKFSEEVHRRQEYFAEELSGSGFPSRLKKLWLSRLVEPKVSILMYYLAESAQFGTASSAAAEKWNKEIASRLGLCQVEASREKSLALLPVHPEVTELFLELHVRWAERKLKRWVEWYALLISLLFVGDEFLTQGKINALVVPWIDKFFISSKRSRDIEYLEVLLEFITTFAPRTKVLFIDDTAKKSDPSLKLAIPELNRRLAPQKIKGLGVFDYEMDAPGTRYSLESIAAAFQDHLMVVIRPYQQVSNYQSFYHLIKTKDFSFLSKEKYDSSWKDNLDFLYWGTPIFPLTGAFHFDPLFHAYLLTKSGPVPFGHVYRALLKEHTGDKKIFHHLPCDLLEKYGEFANILSA